MMRARCLGVIVFAMTMVSELNEIDRQETGPERQLAGRTELGPPLETGTKTRAGCFHARLARGRQDPDGDSSRSLTTAHAGNLSSGRDSQALQEPSSAPSFLLFP